MPKKKMTQREANKKYRDGTTYKTPSGETRRRKSYPKGHPKQKAYCARSAKQKQTKKVKARRAAWKCS